MFDNKLPTNVSRLLDLFSQLLDVRTALKERFPIPRVWDSSQLQPEEGMLITHVDPQRTVSYTIGYPSGFFGPTEHEEPILVTFLLQGYASPGKEYRTIQSLEHEGSLPENYRIFLAGQNITWSYFKDEQLDAMIWKLEQEVCHWKAHQSSEQPVSTDKVAASQRMRELAFALEKLEANDPSNAFIGVMDQTAQVFLEKVNKQFEQALLKKERDGNQA